MPVRRIGLCYRSVSGRVPMGAGRQAVAVESTLERDFALLQRFDPEVAHIEEQPVRIEYRDTGGARRRYVPDFLVRYTTCDRAPQLVEVKFSNDPALLKGDLHGRFAAARSYASQRGWVFIVITEIEIRTPRLANVTFLLPYVGRPSIGSARALLLTVLGTGPMPIGPLVDNVAKVMACNRVQVLPTLWRMVARREVQADLDRPLTMNSLVHLPEGGRP